MLNKRRLSIILLILSVLSMLVILTAHINYYNHALLNRIHEATSLIAGFILICAIFIVQIDIEHWIKYLINIVLTGILIVSLLFAPIAKELCDEKTIFESEYKQYNLLIVRKNCGATTSLEYNVLLLDGGAFLHKEKIIFKSYASPAPIHAEFLNDNTIQISSKDGSTAPNFVVSFDKKTLTPDKTLQFNNGEPY
ncbi:MAG: hypothetical protein GY737_30645 [Desulfobacteraceae bacterium]|nr:hypothetical protein [Desulfobacteraceae bacterium]